MTATTLRPRSPSEIVDAAFQILRAHFGQFVMCAAIAYAPLLVVRLVVIGDPTTALAGGDPTATGRLLMGYMLTFLLSVITYALMSAVLVGCTSQAYLGEEVDVGAAVRRTVRKLPILLAVAALSGILFIVAFILLLFPALYVAAITFALTPAIVLEDAGVFRAFSRSAELAKGRKWHILNTLGLAFLIYFVVQIGLAALGAAMGGFVVQSLISTAVAICVYPMVAISAVLLYYDARIQREGLDIELMAGALAPASAPLAP